MVWTGRHVRALGSSVSSSSLCNQHAPTMIQQRRLPLVALLALGLLIGSGDALKCWTCDSARYPECGDPFNPSHFVMSDCGRDSGLYVPTTPSCKKVEQRVGGGNVVIHRSCAWTKDQDDGASVCSKSSVPSYVQMLYCSSCSTDGCNAAPHLLPSLSVVFLIPLALWFVLKP